jgi:hypothetical protein
MENHLNNFNQEFCSVLVTIWKKIGYSGEEIEEKSNVFLKDFGVVNCFTFVLFLPHFLY